MDENARKGLIERARWYMLRALHEGRPYEMSEKVLKDALAGTPYRLSEGEIRQELRYLSDRKLVEIIGIDRGAWEARLTSAGVDLVEYSVDCRAGIARPPVR